MAIVLDSTSSGSAVSTTVTVSHTCSGSDRILLVAVSGDSTAESVSGVTYNGVAMTSAGTRAISSGPQYYCHLWYLLNPATGANNIVATMTASATENYVTAISYTGVSGVSGYTSNDDVAAGSDTAWTITITSAVGDLAVSFLMSSQDPTVTNGTERIQFSGGEVTYFLTGFDRVGAATVQINGTVASSAWAQTGINLTQSGGGSPTGTMGFITNNLRPNAFAPGLAR